MSRIVTGIKNGGLRLHVSAVFAYNSLWYTIRQIKNSEARLNNLRTERSENGGRQAKVVRGFPVIDSDDTLVSALAERLLKPIGDIPENEKIDAYHIAVAAIYQMDVLLTWNCRHINNPIILPKTISEIALAGYQCPKILTPAEFLEVYDVR